MSKPKTVVGNLQKERCRQIDSTGKGSATQSTKGQNLISISYTKAILVKVIAQPKNETPIQAARREHSLE